MARAQSIQQLSSNQHARPETFENPCKTSTFRNPSRSRKVTLNSKPSKTLGETKVFLLSTKPGSERKDPSPAGLHPWHLAVQRTGAASSLQPQRQQQGLGMAQRGPHRRFHEFLVMTTKVTTPTRNSREFCEFFGNP